VAPRQGDEGRVVIHMEHLKWRPMKLVFKYLHGGKEDDLFDYNRMLISTRLARLTVLTDRSRIA
jgi:hypothetical protein